MKDIMEHYQSELNKKIISKSESQLKILVKKIHQNVIVAKWMIEPNTLWKYKVNEERININDVEQIHLFKLADIKISSMLLTGILLFWRIYIIRCFLMALMGIYIFNLYKIYNQFKMVISQWNQFFNIYCNMDLQIRKAVAWFMQLELIGKGLRTMNIDNTNNNNLDNPIRLLTILKQIEKEFKDMEQLISYEQEDEFQLENKKEVDEQDILNQLKHQLECCWLKRTHFLQSLLLRLEQDQSFNKKLDLLNQVHTILAKLSYCGNGHLVQIVALTELKGNIKEKDITTTNSKSKSKNIRPVLKEVNRLEIQLKNTQVRLYRFATHYSSNNESIKEYHLLHDDILSLITLSNKIQNLLLIEKQSVTDSLIPLTKQSEVIYNEPNEEIILQEQKEEDEEMLNEPETFEMDPIEQEEEFKIKKNRPVRKGEKKMNDNKFNLLEYKLELNNAINELNKKKINK